MIEHISLRCRDPQKSRDFYAKALGAIGYEQDWVYGDSFAFVHQGHHDFWVTPGEVGTPMHVAFRCARRSEVNAFYEAALAAGGHAHGAPGLRRESEYGPDYYAAFVLDPDGHNVEAVSFEHVARSRKKAARTNGAEKKRAKKKRAKKKSATKKRTTKKRTTKKRAAPAKRR